MSPTEKASNERINSEIPQRSMRPGDQAPEGTMGTGENVCPLCSGSGDLDGKACPECEGTGIVISGIGGA